MMSTAATDNVRHESPLRFLAKVPWALADQVLVSATTFVSVVLLAKGLGTQEFGEYTLVFSALLFVNSLQSGIVTQPHNILGVARRGHDDYRLYTNSTFAEQAVLTGASTLLALLAWLLALAMNWHIAPLLLALAPAIVAWQFQEFSRRVLYTEGREARALIVDVLGFGGQIAAISLLWWTKRLTPENALYASAATSAVGAAFGLFSIRKGLGGKVDLALIRENWHLGKWIAGGELVGHWLSAQLFVYMAAWIVGAAAAGVMRVVHTIFGPARILAEVLYTLCMIRFSRVFSAKGRAALHSQLVLTCLIAVPPLAGYCVAVAVFARPILHLLYGGKFDDSADVLRLYAVAMFLSYMMFILSAAMRAKRKTREVFRAQLAASAVALPVGWGLIQWVGVHGIVWGMIATYVGMIVLILRAYLRSAREVEAEATEIPADVAAASAALRERVFQALDAADVPYCVTHGYCAFAGSDVDLVMPRDVVKHDLPALLIGNEAFLGARVVQWIREETDYVVLMGHTSDGTLARICLDVSVDYELAQRPMLTSDEILSTRRRHGSFWRPAADVEFACVLLRRIVKGTLKDGDEARLAELSLEDGPATQRQLLRFFGPRKAAIVEHALRAGDWTAVRRSLGSLRTRALVGAGLRRPGAFLRCLARKNLRRATRHLRPTNGLHLVFLGPDGAGKSSIVKSVAERLSPAFFSVVKRSFPPALLNRTEPNATGLPHDVRPRGPLSSALRALGYWLLYYCPGHLLTIRPDLARCSLVIHDRHLLDTLVDAKRYRYTGPRSVLRLICSLTPKPHAMLVLHAPPDVIQSRKREVSVAETERQVAAYRTLAARYPFATLVDTSGPLDRNIVAAERVILDTLAARTRRQLGLTREADRIEKVRHVLAVHAPTADWQLRRIGTGVQAHIFEAASAARSVVVKLFRPDRPQIAMAVAEEYESLRRLHDVVDGHALDGWHFHTPLPLAISNDPPALVMSKVPGRPLSEVVADPAFAIEPVARVLAAVVDRYWRADRRIYGDFNLNNILCDPVNRSLSLVDPGMPEDAYVCANCSDRYFPASRDLAYAMFDAATLVRSALFQPALRRRQWAMILALLTAVVEKSGDADSRRAFIAELDACCRSHLARIPVALSPRGLRRVAVRWYAATRMRRMLKRLGDRVALTPPHGGVNPALPEATAP